MSPRQSEAAKEFRQPRPSLLPPDRKGQPGKSSPMMETFSAFSMVGVYETRKGLKFVHITSEKFSGKFTVLIFMDNRLTELEAEEWKSFNDKLADFKAIGAQVLGVCTDSHVTVRTMLMNAASLKGIKFPIICDRDGDFSRAFGVLKLSSGNFGAARAVAVLDPETRLVHLRLHNERTRSRPDSFLQLLSRLQGNPSSAKKPASLVSNTPTVPFAGSDAVRKNDKVEDESSKSATLQPADLVEENLDQEAEKTTKQPADLKEEKQEAEKTTKPPPKWWCCGAEAWEPWAGKTSQAPKAPGSETPSKNLAGEDSTKKEETVKADVKKTPATAPSKQAPKAPGSETSNTRSVTPIPFGSVSRAGSNQTPSKTSSEVPSKNLAGKDSTKKDAKATMKTTDKNLEKPPKTTKHGPAVETAKVDVKKKLSAASSKQ